LAETSHRAGVAKQLGQRRLGMQDRESAATLRLVDDRSALLQVADQIADVLVGRADLEPHYWLEQYRARLAQTGVER